MIELSGINRDQRWERTLRGKVELSNRFSNSARAMEFLPEGTEYVEGFATIRFTDVLPSQIVQLEHAWCRLSEGEIVDLSLNDITIGLAHYYPVFALRAIPGIPFQSVTSPVLFYHVFQSISPKAYQEKMVDARKQAIEQFIVYDNLNGADNLWMRIAAKNRKPMKG